MEQENSFRDKIIDAVFSTAANWAKSFIFLRRTVEMLQEEVGKLIDLQSILDSRAPDEERRIKQLSGWMQRVNKVLDTYKDLRNRYDDNASCPRRSLLLRYDASNLLGRVSRLCQDGDDLRSMGNLYGPIPPGFVLVPSDVSSSTMVGAEERLEEIRNHILKRDVKVIGIYGMGGVGKSALLKIINNEILLKQMKNNFDVAIWVELEGRGESAILEKIADRLGLASCTPKEELLEHLSTKRFVLLLDDVWKDLDLVPKIRGKPNTKILFTTRSESICGNMEANVWVEVRPLDAEKSWQLFKKNIGEPAQCLLEKLEIQSLAKEVVDRCGGLPLYLNAVRRFMATVKTESEWEDAAYTLDHFPDELCKGTEEVIQRLKLSYDRLDPRLRDCLLYCALFPRGYAISRDQIVDYWICEGFLESNDHDEYDMNRLRREGNKEVEKLKRVSLFENANSDSAVKLHDAIRNMVQRVATKDHGYVVLAGDVSRVPKLNAWREAKRISFVGKRNIEEGLPDSYWDSISPELTTLLLRDSVHAKNVDRQGFFRRRKKLKVLDLKGGELQRFPAGISRPSLPALQYLDLSDNPFLPDIPVDRLEHLRIRILRPQLQ